MPRNFGLVYPHPHQRKWEALGLSLRDLFQEREAVFSKWVRQHANHTLSYQEELDQLKHIEEKSKSKANEVDPTLLQHVEALYASFSKKIQLAEKKLLRAEKRQHEEKRRQIETVKEGLFPGGTLQERKENFLNYYLKDPAFIQKLKDGFDPFNYRMYLFQA